MKFFLPVVFLFTSVRTLAQAQVCPLNSNFSTGTLTHWDAYTGNNAAGNGHATIFPYSSTAAAPAGTIGATSIDEYQLAGTQGIQVITNNSTDYLGGFETVPTINGYKYAGSVKLGSTAISRGSNTSTSGGYVRGVTYRIAVPAGSSTVPYTMTYAYAMVLENGTHNSDQQPLFSATLVHNGTVITCASPKYYLPTHDNADTRGTGATLDTVAAENNGFYLSAHPSPNSNPNSNSPNAGHLYDVWAKGWTEVTFDLSPYRGDNVDLTFETDNCVPGGHFAYSYVALRSDCGGLIISGAAVACQGSILTYSIPGLAGATYHWSGIPADWSVVSGLDSNILKVKVGRQAGAITALENNSCASLTNALNVITSPPTVAGFLGSDSRVCIGNTSPPITLTGYFGGVLNWLSSTDGGLTYSPLPVTTDSYTAQNLQTTTVYRALVQAAASCDIDTSNSVVVRVDPKSVGGTLNPSDMLFCMGQNKDAKIILSGQTGAVENWQSSADGTTWTDLSPANLSTEFDVVGITSSTQYRIIVKSGVCPEDISSKATVNLLSASFPQAATDPGDTTICYNDSANLNAHITLGTSYTWTNTGTLRNEGDGDISVIPYNIRAIAHPLKTTYYVLNIVNTGCPNPLLDTFHVHVIDPIIVDAGRDTAIVFNEPLQLHAVSNDTAGAGDIFTWTPVTGLDNPNTADPIATLGAFIDSVRYVVRATSELGCFGTADILVKVFKTAPEIFVPNAFTPGGASNNIFRPIPVGIATFQYFRVYNRWGQLVYSTSATGQGWDGRINGRMQDTGSYVWMTQGISYTGKVVFRKGTMVLIR